MRPSLGRVPVNIFIIFRHSRNICSRDVGHAHANHAWKSCTNPKLLLPLARAKFDLL